MAHNVSCEYPRWFELLTPAFVGLPQQIFIESARESGNLTIRYVDIVLYDNVSVKP